MSVALSFHRSLHKRPGGWTPKELGTLDLWLDADDATTITISTGVSQWDDKSGNAYHVTQATGANQPAWTKNGLNGRAVLTLDGTNDALTGGDVLDMATGGLSVAAVGSPSNGNTIIGKYRTSSVNYTWNFSRAGMTTRMTVITTASGTTTTAAQVVAGTVDRTAGITFWKDGAQTGTIAANYPNTDNANSAFPLLVGATTSSADNVSLTTFYQGTIGEVIVSLATWTTDERQKVEGYLAHKWGLTASLPSDHPHKSIAP